MRVALEYLFYPTLLAVTVLSGLGVAWSYKTEGKGWKPVVFGVVSLIVLLACLLCILYLVMLYDAFRGFSLGP
jgi:hypothetical protein